MSVNYLLHLETLGRDGSPSVPGPDAKSEEKAKREWGESQGGGSAAAETQAEPWYPTLGSISIDPSKVGWAEWTFARVARIVETLGGAVGAPTLHALSLVLLLDGPDARARRCRDAVPMAAAALLLACKSVPRPEALSAKLTVAELISAIKAEGLWGVALECGGTYAFAPLANIMTLRETKDLTPSVDPKDWSLRALIVHYEDVLMRRLDFDVAWESAHVRALETISYGCLWATELAASSSSLARGVELNTLAARIYNVVHTQLFAWSVESRLLVVLSTVLAMRTLGLNAGPYVTNFAPEFLSAPNAIEALRGTESPVPPEEGPLQKSEYVQALKAQLDELYTRLTCRARAINK